MEKIIVSYESIKSTILIGDNLDISSLCKEYYSPKKVHFITDKTTHSLYFDKISSTFDIPVSFTVINDGESSKSLSVLEGIYKGLNRAEITRSDLIIALGGGVVGDLSAYAAGTYLRGTKFCMIPTTLLSQVDSSVGGKCGINTSFGKNTVGMFNPATLVLIDPTFLKTLPKRTYSDGLAEVVKYSYISDKLSPQEITHDMNLSEIISKCVKIKAEIVSEDLYDTGGRMILNLGHTVGHAIERLGEYKKFTHGEAVGMGLVFAAKLSVFYKGLSENVVFEICDVLQKFDLPTNCEYSSKELYTYIISDKKRMASDISFIFIDKDKKAAIEKIPLDLLCKLLTDVEVK